MQYVAARDFFIDALDLIQAYAGWLHLGLVVLIGVSLWWALFFDDR